MHTVNDFCIVRALREFCTTTKIIKAVIPDKRGAIRNPGIKELVPRLRGDDVWIPACVGMTKLAVLCGCAKFSYYLQGLFRYNRHFQLALLNAEWMNVRYFEIFEKCHFEERERRLMSFRRSEATEKSKDPSLHSGHGFLPSVEMTKKKSK